MPPSERSELLPPLGGTEPTEAAFEDIGRAVDNAVRSIFELARSLEFLNDAIAAFRDETEWQLDEWQHARAGTEDVRPR